MIFKSVHTKLEKLSSKYGIIGLFILAHSVLLSMMLITFPRINSVLGTEAFDLKTFGYSFSEATIMIQNLDQNTIEFYLFPQLFFLDVLYPVLLALFLSAVIIRLSIIIKLNDVMSNLYLLPFIAMFADYLENIMISLLITNAEFVSFASIKIASSLTLLKSTFTILSWIIIFGMLVLWFKQKWLSKRDLGSHT